MKYAYPAVFTKGEDGYSVVFPDIEGCATGGGTLPEAMEMAQDALCLMLFDHEEDGEDIPAPSDPKSIPVDQASIVSMICCDTVEYRKLYDNKAVKKTLTIPNWLNTLAERAGVNFSLTLQTALKNELHIQ
jgi:predicted RNase H-like HicB family nuclease